MFFAIGSLLEPLKRLDTKFDFNMYTKIAKRETEKEYENGSFSGLKSNRIESVSFFLVALQQYTQKKIWHSTLANANVKFNKVH